MLDSRDEFPTYCDKGHMNSLPENPPVCNQYKTLFKGENYLNPRLYINYFALDGVFDQVSPVVQVEFRHQVGPMGLDGLDGDG